jgi:predicted transposase YbfD/YdcC
MNDLVIWLHTVEDSRQQHKVKHCIPDIVLLVLLAYLANVEYWEEIEDFAHVYKEQLSPYLSFRNGIPSHDTIQRVMGLLNPKVTAELQVRYAQLSESKEGTDLRKLLAIDGKTMRGNRSGTQTPLHIVSAYSKEDGLCFGQEPVSEKSNEITAIPVLLKRIAIENTIVTIDAMGTQKKIAETILKEKGDYCLAVKKNQLSLFEELEEYFATPSLLSTIKQQGNYHQTIESARGQIETREYYSTSEVDWLNTQKSTWAGLKGIGFTRNTIEKPDGSRSTEVRYFILSFDAPVTEFARAVRGHWAVESMHWHLDVTFREDANKTQDKVAAQNMNNLRKLCLAILKRVDTGKKMSMRRKRLMLSMNLGAYLAQLFQN